MIRLGSFFKAVRLAGCSQKLPCFAALRVDGFVHPCPGPEGAPATVDDLVVSSLGLARFALGTAETPDICGS